MVKNLGVGENIIPGGSLKKKKKRPRSLMACLDGGGEEGKLRKGIKVV